MRWVRKEDGVAALMVAIMLVSLLVLAAFAVDIGAGRAKKRQLRIGADAAVLAIAEECGLNPAQCTTANAGAIASQYATANDQDGVAGVSDLVLDPIGQTVSLSTYAVDPDSGANGVKTRLAGIIGIDHIEVEADAAAEWGWAGNLAVLPLIIDLCTFKRSPTDVEVWLIFFDGAGQGQGGEEECSSEPAGQDSPGTFGWLDTDGTCHTLAEYLGWVTAFPGGGAGAPPNDCDADWMLENLLDQDVAVPVYDEVQGSGNNTEYHVVGFAVFHVTGYQFGNASGFTQPAGFSCPIGAGQMCMRGHFTTDTIFEGAPGGPNFGLLVVRLTE